MDFSYSGAFQCPPGEAYEKLLLDAMRGDATLFARRDGDEQAGRCSGPVLEGWDAPRSRLAFEYAAGRQRPRPRRTRSCARRPAAGASLTDPGDGRSSSSLPDARALARRRRRADRRADARLQ
jgi:hypothetical protein